MYTLLKLKNGLEVIGKVVNMDYHGVELEDPFVINYRFVAGQPIPTISLSRYIPFAHDHQHLFARVDVMHESAPSQAFGQYYANSVEYCREVVDKSVEEELATAAANAPKGKASMKDIYNAILERTQMDGPLN
jgi:hypothetical protein